MSWLFWKRDRESEIDNAVSQLGSQLAEIKENIAKINERTANGLEQWEEFSGQLTKLTRIQYKGGQETHGKLEQLAQGIEKMQQWQNAEKESVHTLTRQREYLLDVLVCQLDEIDAAYAGLENREDHAWQSLLQQWAQRIIAAMAEVGIYEVDVVGKTFEPQVAEGVGVVPRTPGTIGDVPYEVVQVIKRGLMNGEGNLLRKAQVITYQEVEKQI